MKETNKKIIRSVSVFAFAITILAAQSSISVNAADVDSPSLNSTLTSDTVPDDSPDDKDDSSLVFSEEAVTPPVDDESGQTSSKVSPPPDIDTFPQDTPVESVENSDPSVPLPDADPIESIPELKPEDVKPEDDLTAPPSDSSIAENKEEEENPPIEDVGKDTGEDISSTEEPPSNDDKTDTPDSTDSDESNSSSTDDASQESETNVPNIPAVDTPSDGEESVPADNIPSSDEESEEIMSFDDFVALYGANRSLLDIAADYTLFLEQNYIQYGSGGNVDIGDGQGIVAIGGDMIFENTAASSITVGGSVIGSTNCPVISGEDCDIDFASTFDALREASANLSTNFTGTTINSSDPDNCIVNEWGTVKFKGTDPTLNVFTLTVEEYNALVGSESHSTNYDVPAGSVVLINIVGEGELNLVTGWGCSYAGNQLTSGNADNANVLVNVPDAQTVKIGSSVGSLLAPNSHITSNENTEHYEGQVIARSFEGSVEFGHTRFNRTDAFDNSPGGDDPNDPNDPDNPDNPDNPNDPNKPDNPDGPNGGDNGEDPDDPNKPDNPGNNNGGDNPDDPNNPNGGNDNEDPDNPDNPNKPDNPDKPSGGNDNEDPDNPDKPNGDSPDGPNKPDNPDNPNGDNGGENPDNPDDPNKPVNPDKPTGGDNNENPDSPDKPGGPDAPDNPDKPAGGDGNEDSDTPDKPNKPGKPSDGDKPDRPDTPNKPDKPDRPDDYYPPIPPVFPSSHEDDIEISEGPPTGPDEEGPDEQEDIVVLDEGIEEHDPENDPVPVPPHDDESLNDSSDNVADSNTGSNSDDNSDSLTDSVENPKTGTKPFTVPAVTALAAMGVMIASLSCCKKE